MYDEQFKNLEDLKREYQLKDKDLEGVEILYAAYKTGSYDGQSIVLFKIGDKLFIVEADHCSCHGLEEKWDPIETNEDTLKKEILAKGRYFYREFESFINFCEEYFRWTKKTQK